MKKILIVVCIILIAGVVAFLSRPVAPTAETVTKTLDNARFEQKETPQAAPQQPSNEAPEKATP